jgi:hypothetical protein
MTVYESTQNGTKLETGLDRDGHMSIVNGKGSGFYVNLSEQDRRELALELLAESHDLRFYPGPNGTRRIDAVLKEKPLPEPKVGEFYRLPGEPDMADPWRNSPVVRVKYVHGLSYVTLETVDGKVTGWSNIRALGEPLKVTEHAIWVAEES